jgi:hypothetical protein
VIATQGTMLQRTTAGTYRLNNKLVVKTEKLPFALKGLKEVLQR